MRSKSRLDCLSLSLSLGVGGGVGEIGEAQSKLTVAVS